MRINQQCNDKNIEQLACNLPLRTPMASKKDYPLRKKTAPYLTFRITDHIMLFQWKQLSLQNDSPCA